MRSTRAVVVALVALLLGLVSVAAATGSASGASRTPAGTPAGVETHAAATTKAAADRVTAYWTAERMREAKPAKAPSTANASSTGSPRAPR